MLDLFSVFGEPQGVRCVLDPGWLREKVGSGVATTICMCHELFSSSTSTRQCTVNVTGRSGEKGRLLNLWTVVRFVVILFF